MQAAELPAPGAQNGLGLKDEFPQFAAVVQIVVYGPVAAFGL